MAELTLMDGHTPEVGPASPNSGSGTFFDPIGAEQRASGIAKARPGTPSRDDGVANPASSESELMKGKIANSSDSPMSAERDTGGSVALPATPMKGLKLADTDPTDDPEDVKSEPATPSTGRTLRSKNAVVPKSDVTVDPESENETPETPTPTGPREFTCCAEEKNGAACNTGQTTMALARKTISHHFGRNKACTREVKDWPLYCRKHYQRATYKSEQWQVTKLRLIEQQFDKIEKMEPGTVYTVQFKKSEEDRLNAFARLVSNGIAVAAAKEDVKVKPKADAKSFEAPIDVLRELEYRIGEDKNLLNVKETLSLIATMLAGGETKQVPSIEFLPTFPAATPAKVDPPVKKAPKSPKTPKTPKTPKKGSGGKGGSSSKGRIAAKGAVQKLK